jgi:hypothetical protein
MTGSHLICREPNCKCRCHEGRYEDGKKLPQSTDVPISLTGKARVERIVTN